jgi:arylsulfatase A-like enzyme
MHLEVVSLLLAGFLFALLELLWVLVRGHALFLSGAERSMYALAAFSALPVLVFAAGILPRIALASGLRQTLRQRGLALLTTLLAARAAWLLTAGRRVRDLHLRPLLVLVLALLVGVLMLKLLELAAHVRIASERRPRVLFSAFSGALVLVSLCLDALVLPRGYPPFHVSLMLTAAVLTGLATSVWSLPVLPRGAAAGAVLLALLLAGAAPFALQHLAAQPNASFVVYERAPWSGKLLRWSSAGKRRPAAPEKAVAASAVTHEKGIDLRDQDVLLVTVDALRADELRAYGGRGVASEMDHLAQESVVFRRAYTAAPHTSYALTSLLTAKFMKPVVELPGARGDHTTLPDILRRYGYRTAAFYPPAIFFVDGSRFTGLRERGFGFEYQKQQFSTAGQRVEQVKRYLDAAEPGHPLFVWVHFFEPHEPYDPPPGLARDDSARGRYEGEVRACDHAVGDLVRAFRAKRPAATVILTADHGEEFGEHGGTYHGTTLYDEQVRVPLLWSSPGRAQPGVSDAPVEIVDIGTTLLSALGMPRDARMRGDDVGAVLRDSAAPGPAFAFASVEDRNMASDGKLKAVCSAHDDHCQLFDLVTDPSEQKNLALERPQDVARLRSALTDFLSSIPRTEALTVTDGVGFPAALARAKLGAPGAGADVVPLLADPRPAIRAAAARALGELSVHAALPMLARLRESDGEAEVRAEAAIAALSLGDDGAADEVSALLGDTRRDDFGLSRASRAALALARLQRPEALPALSELVLDHGAQEADRIRGIEALGTLGARKGVDALVRLLDDVRLRSSVAKSLASLGGKRAADALADALAHEPYQNARTSLARALQALGDRRTRPLVERFLGMETGIPEGIRILIELKALDIPGGSGVRLANARVRKGVFSCARDACTPGEGAVLLLPARPGRGPVRVTFLVEGAESGAALRVNGQALPARAREDQLSLVLPSAQAARSLSLAAQGTLAVSAAVVVKSVPEIPPPAPEPWDGGVPEDAADSVAPPATP